MKEKSKAIMYAVAAAALYAVNIPLSKILLASVPPMMMASFLYIGAGVGMIAVSALKNYGDSTDAKLEKSDAPFVVGMLVLDIAAPILLMFGLEITGSSNVSLINNFEIVATSIIALLFFKERISARLWSAILLIITASIILGVKPGEGFEFDKGSFLVLAATVCWGVENNCTRMLSKKSATDIVIIKGLFSGLGALVVAILSREIFPYAKYILYATVLGFVSYGMSIKLYIMSQKSLGAAKTSSFYSIAPFLGVFFSLVLIGERPERRFYVAFLIMMASTVLLIKDKISLQHTHEHTHTHSHEHSHGDYSHSHLHTHTHTHIHAHFGEEDIHSHEHGEAHGKELEHHDDEEHASVRCL